MNRIERSTLVLSLVAMSLATQAATVEAAAAKKGGLAPAAMVMANQALEDARAAMAAAEAAGAPIWAKELYDEASFRFKFAQENLDAEKRGRREEARFAAVEARYAARAAEAKARLIGTTTEVRNLRGDITRLGGTLPSMDMPGEAGGFNRGATSKEKVNYAQMILDRSKIVGAQLVAGGDIDQAETNLALARKILLKQKDSGSADHLAYTAEMLARRAEFLARRVDMDKLIPGLRLERTRLAQVATEAEAAAERNRREEAERQATELRKQLETESANRRAQAEELKQLREKVADTERQMQARLEQDRTSRIEAEKSLDALMARYESAITNAQNSAEVDELRRQVEDQRMQLRNLQDRERGSEQTMRMEVDRLREDLARERGAGKVKAETLAEREGEIARRSDELERLRKEREENDKRRMESDRAREAALAEAEQKRRKAEEESAQLRQQMEVERMKNERELAAGRETVARTQTELEATKAELSRRETIDADREKYASMQKAIGKLAKTRTEERGLIVTLPGIFFDAGKSVVKPGARNVLNRIATELKTSEAMKVAVEGHTDDVGSEESNQALSEKRADAVRSWLVEQGVSAERITMAGRGESAPVASNKTSAGRQQNRRVELIISR